jgi:hypothetical protein
MDVNRLMLGVDDDNIDMGLKLFLANFDFSLIDVTTTSVTVNAGSGWQSIYFSLAASDLTPFAGTAADTLQNVQSLCLFHRPGGVAPNLQGAEQFIVSELQIANMHANPVPVPPAILFLLSGLVGLWTRVRIDS